jgi:hypothetical protein
VKWIATITSILVLGLAASAQAQRFDPVTSCRAENVDLLAGLPCSRTFVATEEARRYTIIGRNRDFRGRVTSWSAYGVEFLTNCKGHGQRRSLRVWENTKCDHDDHGLVVRVRSVDTPTEVTFNWGVTR